MTITTIRTSRWGPPAWEFLFCVALNHHFSAEPEKDDTTTHFFESLGGVLPCVACQRSYTELKRLYPLSQFLRTHQERPYACFAWLYFIKDQVNEKLRRQEASSGGACHTDRSPPFAEVLRRYLEGGYLVRDPQCG